MWYISGMSKAGERITDAANELLAAVAKFHEKMIYEAALDATLGIPGRIYFDGDEMKYERIDPKAFTASHSEHDRPDGQIWPHPPARQG